MLFQQKEDHKVRGRGALIQLQEPFRSKVCSGWLGRGESQRDLNPLKDETCHCCLQDGGGGVHLEKE